MRPQLTVLAAALAASLAVPALPAAADLATAPPDDQTGPVIDPLEPAGAATVTSPSATVSGVASDPSGIASVTVGGVAAVVSGTGGFAVAVQLAPGPNSIAVRAVDGVGNVTERTVVITWNTLGVTPVKARARIIRVYRAGPATVVRYRVDPGAARVTTRLWRSVRRPGQLPLWTPAGPLRAVRRAAGVHVGVVGRARLRAGVYQVRVTVASAGGVAVATARYVA